MTFRVRTALVVLVLTAFTMGGAFGIVWQRFVASQRTQLDRALIQVAVAEAREATAGSLDFTDAPGPSANAVGPLPKYGVIYAAGGRPLSTTGNLTKDSAPTMPRLVPFETGFDFDFEGKPMRGVVVGVEGTAMRLLLATTRDDLEDDAAILARAMTIAFFVGCLWAAIVAFGVATRLTQEHSLVGAVARRVASGDTSARVAFRSKNSDLRQLANDLNAMIERLVGLHTMQERFVAHAAHELRTPLTSLRMEIEMALRDPAATREDLESALRGALESTQRLTALAEDLLELARVKTADRPALEPIPVDDAIADAVAVVAPLARARDIQIWISSIVVDVIGYRGGVARLFRNLLENAIRFSPDGGKVEIEATQKEDTLEIAVTDEGPGIPESERDRVFEPFARLGGADHADGTGLGLAIARELARSYGGDVRVTDRDGKGAAVVVSLPTA